MLEQDYIIRRSKLVREFNNLRIHRLNLSAKARVRMIAKLDLEQKRIPIEDTYKKFKYYEL